MARLTNDQICAALKISVEDYTGFNSDQRINAVIAVQTRRTWAEHLEACAERAAKIEAGTHISQIFSSGEVEREELNPTLPWKYRYE